MCELNPCPFCGGKAEIRSHQDGCAAWITCTCCNGQSGGFQDCGIPLNVLKDKAIDEWNSRYVSAGYQKRVEAAHNALFHDDPTDIAERNARSFEESIETAQAFGMTEDEAIALVKYTFSRPVGDPAKELGAKVLTAFSLGVVAGIDVMAAAEADLEKLQRPETIARIRAKRSTRHGRGPLPGFDPSTN